MTEAQLLNLVSRLRQFKEAAFAVGEAWLRDEHCDDGSSPDYPFDKGFDEMTLDIERWVTAMTTELVAEAEQVWQTGRRTE